jgi:hypothetical protein
VDVTPDQHVYVFDTTGAHQYAIVPEPSPAVLLGMGALALLRRRRWKREGLEIENLVSGRRSFLRKPVWPGAKSAIFIFHFLILNPQCPYGIVGRRAEDARPAKSSLATLPSFLGGLGVLGANLPARQKEETPALPGKSSLKKSER